LWRSVELLETCKLFFKNFLRTPLRNRVFTLFALWICVLAVQSSDAHANGFSRSSRSKRSAVSFTLGVRYWVHYNRITVASTPPESVLAEAQLNYWISGGSFGFQLSGATAISLTQATYFGLGVRLKALNIQSGKAVVVGGFSLILFADGLLFNVAAPVAPQSYEPSGFLIRYGASINWLFGGSGKFYLDTTMAVSNFQDNFFIGPYVGIGVKF
jgi:hypothetical protein